MANLRGVFAQNLKLQLVTKKWTAYRLAKESGLNPSTIQRIVNGDTAPTIDVIGAIAKALEVPPVKLFSRA